jgi:hypothetical protein
MGHTQGRACMGTHFARRAYPLHDSAGMVRTVAVGQHKEPRPDHGPCPGLPARPRRPATPYGGAVVAMGAGMETHALLLLGRRTPAARSFLSPPHASVPRCSRGQARRGGAQQMDPRATRSTPQGRPRTECAPVSTTKALVPLVHAPSQGGMCVYAPIQPPPTVAYSGQPRRSSGKSVCGSDHGVLVRRGPHARRRDLSLHTSPRRARRRERWQ